MPILRRLTLAGAAFGLGIAASSFMLLVNRGGDYARVAADVSLASALWFAMPFFALAFLADGVRWSPWIAGIGATMSAQLTVFADVMLRPGGGVNILLGLLVQLSPIPIAATVLLINWIVDDPAGNPV